MEGRKRMEKLYFMSLASGSSGNCYYLGVSSYGILIDAGIGVRQIKKVLKDNQVALESIMAVLVTHDHADHIKSVGYLGEVAHIPIYAVEKVHSAIDCSRYVEETLIWSRRIIEKEVPFQIRDFNIEAFDVPHDSSDNVGYRIKYGGQCFVILTDVGRITDEIRRHVAGANYLVLESNYDEEMLASGHYPDFLKERIKGGAGHLSNRDAAEFLVEIYTPELKNVWLCHLSRDNNHPELAAKTAELCLFGKGVKVGKDLSLTSLKRMSPSPMFELGIEGIKGMQ